MTVGEEVGPKPFFVICVEHGKPISLLDDGCKQIDRKGN